MPLPEARAHAAENRGICSRRILLGAGWIGFLFSLVAPALANIRFLFPNVLYEPPTRIKLKPPSAYPVGSATFIPEQRAFLFREAGGFRCVSAICTHLRCTINPFGEADDEFPEPHAHCPCHGSVFAKKDGRVLRSPAPAPLAMYEVSLAPDGRLVVDTGKPVSPETVFKA